MASSYLPKPGTQYGPCKTTCDHSDCKQTRLMAASICSLCGKPIGYDRHLYNGDSPGTWQHATCVEQEFEDRSRQVRT